MKVIPIEECAQQHNLVVWDLTVRIPTAKKSIFIPCIGILKLRDKAVANEFHATLTEKVAAAATIDFADTVEVVWARIKTYSWKLLPSVMPLLKNHQ